MQWQPTRLHWMVFVRKHKSATRTTLDVLDAQNELVNAQVALANARRDRIVAGYQLVAAIGHMTAADLRLSVNIYDPRRNLEEVRDKAFGARINTSE